jgi:flagellar hook-length control protein FliK
MQVNLASALGAIGFFAQPTDDAQVAAGLSLEVQEKVQPPTQASIAIDEAIASLLEEDGSELGLPPILQPKKTESFFEVEGNQPNADLHKPDEEWKTEKVAPDLKTSTETMREPRPPILQPWPFVASADSVSSTPTPTGFDSDTYEAQSPPILQPKPKPFPPMALGPDVESKTVSAPIAETFAVSQDGDQIASIPAKPAPPLVENPFGRKGESTESKIESSDRPQAAPSDRPAPGLVPKPQAKVKILDRLQRLLDRIAPQARAAIIELRDKAIDAAKNGVPFEKVAAEVEVKVKQAVDSVIAVDRHPITGAPIKSVKDRIALNSQRVIEAIARVLKSPSVDNELRVLLPKDESVIVERDVVANQPGHGMRLQPMQSNVLDVARALESPKVAQTLMANVIDRIQQMVDGRREQSVTIRLDPPELGSIDVTVKTVNGRVDTQIVASNADVRAFVEANREMLSQMLANRGLELGSMSVGTHGNGSGQSHDSQKLNAPIWKPDVAATAVSLGFTSWNANGALDLSA